MCQTQIAQLRTPDWVNDNIDHIKEYVNRTFLDDWPMSNYKQQAQKSPLMGFRLFLHFLYWLGR
ncbi:hypothetical protein [Marinomonas sp. A3A]|uniref:hypothetical protein n=1 Tax=Marinomonas sp. A3A TaxID=2065312 RepID=UPI001BB3BAA6|nr:hypothetical protein [Marinomonas sp. A3A]